MGLVRFEGENIAGFGNVAVSRQIGRLRGGNSWNSGVSSESGHVCHRRLFCVVGCVGIAALFCCLERLFDLLDQQALYCCVVVGFGEQDFAIGTDDKVAGNVSGGVERVD